MKKQGTSEKNSKIAPKRSKQETVLVWVGGIMNGSMVAGTAWIGYCMVMGGKDIKQLGLWMVYYAVFFAVVMISALLYSNSGKKPSVDEANNKLSFDMKDPVNPSNFALFVNIQSEEQNEQAKAWWPLAVELLGVRETADRISAADIKKTEAA
jgi:hypothetical protein